MKTLIRDEDSRLAISSYILTLNVNAGYVVNIEQPKSTRSVAINALYWLWVDVIADYWGHSKNDTHARLKLAHAVPILSRDVDFNQMWCSVQCVQDDEFHLSVARLISTAKFTNKIFSEYLKEIEKDMLFHVKLPKPEDLYFESMGIKR